MSNDNKNAAAPVDLRENIKSLRTYANGYYIRRDEVLAAIESTPAAPGIDLGNMTMVDRGALQMAINVLRRAGKDEVADALIDASPKGGESMRNWSLRMAKLEEGQHVGAGAHGLQDSPKGGIDDAEPMFYIQDTRSFVGNCPMWWAPNGAGYVTRLDEAGRFTEQEAIRKNRSRETDVPWPCAEIDKLGRITVDMQHMRPRSERLAELQANSAEVGECNCANGRAECMPDCASRKPTSHGAGVSDA